MTLSAAGAASTRTWPKRALAVALGLLLAPLLMEAALQLAALFFSGNRAEDGVNALVLCQGDSNTFGLNLPKEQAYPGQLEALLRPAYADAHVVNRGVPGKPTWIVDQELDADLARFRPRAIVVMCGLNNCNQVRPEREVDRWLNHSRVLAMVRRLTTQTADARVEETKARSDKRLALNAVKNTAPGEQRVRVLDREEETRAFVLRFGSPTDQQAQQWIIEDLQSIAAKARAAGAVPLFCTYFENGAWMGPANRAIEAAALSSGTRLVDTRPFLREAIQRVGRWELVFPDHHLRADGYAVLARVLFNALVEEGVVEGQPVDPLEMLGRVRDESIGVTPWIHENELIGVEVQFAPAMHVQLVLSGSEGKTQVFWDQSVVVGKSQRQVELPLAQDALMDQALERVKRYRVPLDLEGHGRILLDKQDASAQPLFACVVAISPPGTIEVVSPAFKLR